VTLAEAVRTIKRTQPVLDAVKEDDKANKAAKKILGAHMVEHNLDAYRGISMREVEYDAWDDEKLRGHLGDQVAGFRVKRPRRYFTVIGRKRRA
jgi:hypothetical protein